MNQVLQIVKTTAFLLISILFVFKETVAQEQTPQFENFKSIHQVEWELHRNFVTKAKVPRFEGPPMNLVRKAAAPSKEIFGYLPYWMFAYYSNLNYNLLTTIAYFGAEVTDQGNLINLRDWPAAGLVNKAHSKGVRVVLTAFNFLPPSITSVLSDPNRRINLISKLLAQVQAANADGVNIDFEGVPGDQRLNLTKFMTELTDAFHAAIPGSFVTIFTPAVDWNDAFDYFALAQITDGLIISGYDYHWRTAPSAGPVSPLTGTRWGPYNITLTVDDYLSKTAGNTTKLILGVPFYGYEWPTVSDNLEAATRDVGRAIFYNEAYPNAMQYGRLWDEESHTPWYKYNDSQWHQGWYDDSLSLALKFEFVKTEDLKGIGIWALSYDGERQELQGALADAFGATAAPLKPTAFRIVNLGDGRVQITVNPSSGATAYKIYQSLDGVNFTQGTVFPNAASILTGLAPDTTYYFKISAMNGNGESNLTEVLAVRPTSELVEILIVNGFDRTTGTVNTFDFIKRFAPSVAKQDYAFDSCANEAVEDRDILLTNYKIVLWISGEEGTATLSFSPIEQTLVAEYLENGGNLFVSGSEIGYHLEERGRSSDKAFYRSYLKADYIKDDTGAHSVSGSANGIFSNLLAITFDNGRQGTYDVDFPDGIKPVDGAVMNMTYDGVNPNISGGAGLQYEGVFGNGDVPGRLVYLGFPFETVYPERSRDLMMSAVLKYFQGLLTSVAQMPDTTPGPEEFELAQNYPNPFNPSTTISFRLTNKIPKQTTLKIFNLLGQEIKTLIDERLSAGKYEVVWDGRDTWEELMSSGVYIYRLQVGSQVKVKIMTLVK